MEKWLPVVGFEGRYEVSDRGRIKSLIRSVPRILALQEDGRGYLSVKMCDGYGGKPRKRIHRLVMEAFVGAAGPGVQVDHKDNNPGNNLLDNLQYVSHFENSSILRRERTLSCKRGHPYVGGNEYWRRGRRECVRCMRNRRQRWHAENGR